MGLRHELRDRGAHALWRAGRTDPARGRLDQLTILTFHRFLPEPLRAAYPYPGLAVTPSFLRSLLLFLRDRVELTTVSAGVRRLREEKPARPLVALAVDDGVLDNAAYGRAVFAELDVKATFYVTAGLAKDEGFLWHDLLGFAVQHLRGRPRAAWRGVQGFVGHDAVGDDDDGRAERLAQAAKRLPIDDRGRFLEALRRAAGGAQPPAWARMMGFDDVRALHAEGHEIGAHTLTHPILLRPLHPDLEHEVQGSRAVLESELDAPVVAFAYPNGDCDDDARRAVDAAGYTSAVTTRIGVNRATDDPLTLARLDVQQDHNSRGGAFDPALFAWRLQRAQRADRSAS